MSGLLNSPVVSQGEGEIAGGPGSGADTGGPVLAAGIGGSPSPAHPLVVGLDLSLVATGVAVMTPSGLRTHRITVEGRGILRLRRIAGEIRTHIRAADLVVVEGPSYGSVGAGTHERAGLWWLVQDRLWRHGIACAVVPPANLKKYAVGAGGGKNASKDKVLLAAARQWPFFTGDNNEADAAWLAQMGLDYLTGHGPVPDRHRASLAGCTWPVVAAAS